MNVADMKQLIANMPDDAQILIWVGIADSLEQDRNEIDMEAVDVEDDYHVSGNGQIPAVHLAAIIRSPT